MRGAALRHGADLVATQRKVGAAEEVERDGHKNPVDRTNGRDAYGERVEVDGGLTFSDGLQVVCEVEEELGTGGRWIHEVHPVEVIANFLRPASQLIQ